MSEIEITEKNFEEYFFDIRKNKPQRGQIIACYSAVAELQSGPEKQQIINLLLTKDKIIPALQIMRNLMCIRYEDAIRVLKEMSVDLMSQTVGEVMIKPYKFTIHVYFYTKTEYVPKDDPHWSIVSIVDMDKFFQSDMADGVQIKSKFIKE